MLNQVKILYTTLCSSHLRDFFWGISSLFLLLLVYQVEQWYQMLFYQTLIPISMVKREKNEKRLFDDTLIGDWFSNFYNFKVLVLLWINGDNKINYACLYVFTWWNRVNNPMLVPSFIVLFLVYLFVVSESLETTTLAAAAFSPVIPFDFLYWLVIFLGGCFRIYGTQV